MLHYHSDAEPTTERLLFVSLTPLCSEVGQFRHINACVIRRAASHVTTVAPAPSGVEGATVEHTVWGDDKVATGYRNATWSSGLKSAVYVEGMYLSGQMDTGENKMNSGAPYGNELEYRLSRIRSREAKLVSEAFTKIAAKAVKLEQKGFLYANTFEGRLVQLAATLGINMFVFQRDPMSRDSSFTTEGNFREVTFSGVQFEVEKLVNLAQGRAAN